MSKIKVSTTAHVAADPEKAFAYVADFATHGQWSTEPLTVTPDADGPCKVGATYHSEVKFMGKTIKAKQTVTEYDPPRRFAFSSDEGQVFVNEYTFAPGAGGGTDITRTISTEQGGIKGAFQSLVVPIAAPRFWKKQVVKLQANLGG